jgi:hypothetical protein
VSRCCLHRLLVVVVLGLSSPFVHRHSLLLLPRVSLISKVALRCCATGAFRAMSEPSAPVVGDAATAAAAAAAPVDVLAFTFQSCEVAPHGALWPAKSCHLRSDGKVSFDHGHYHGSWVWARDTITLCFHWRGHNEDAKKKIFQQIKPHNVWVSLDRCGYQAVLIAVPLPFGATSLLGPSDAEAAYM